MIPTNSIYDYESTDSSCKGGYYEVFQPHSSDSEEFETEEDDNLYEEEEV